MAEETTFVVSNTKLVKAALTDTTTIYVQAQAVRGEEDIASITASFQKVTQAIEDIAQSLTAAWEKAKPSRAVAEFGVDFAYDTGEVMAMFVNGSAKASIKITLEWGEPRKDS
ncbi:MAG TPA: CU044_2847 family protein [Ktedonobacteraceae bacterium]|nr:CU044_2847 family protein [Ktedonobacteraceae bacterium]